MSPILPQYQRLAGDDDWRQKQPSNNALDVIDDLGLDDEQVPAYPPRLGGTSGSDTNANVTYIFVPRYPVKGKQDSILGVIKSKDETIEMIQRAFPILSDYPAGRIEFLAPQTPETKLGDEDGWSRIMDEAWSRFRADSPGRLKVQVADGPGDEESRQRKQTRENWMIASCFIVPILLLIIFMITLGVMGKLD